MISNLIFKHFFCSCFRQISHQVGPILCLVEVIAVEPNMKCVQSEKAISRLLIPLTNVDTSKPKKCHSLQFDLCYTFVV